MTVCSRMTVSFTRSCASTFSRVESSISSGASETTAASDLKWTLYTSAGCWPIPIEPNRNGSVDSMTQ